MLNLVPPLTYQGGKQRIADEILNIINPSFDQPFNDLCCGSGAITIALINRNFPIQNITMVDQGPFGLFWESVGKGTFSLNEFKYHLNQLPKDISQIQAHVKGLSKNPADQNTIYIYLILQASSFGGKAIWIKDNKWQNSSFRSYWLPTATSNRQSPVNPMMPMPETLYERVALVYDKMFGITGICDDIRNVIPKGLVYIDPPYTGTTFYGHKLNVLEYVKKLKCKCFISEGKPLSEKNWQIAKTRLKGGISGLRQSMNEEWLSEITTEE